MTAEALGIDYKYVLCDLQEGDNFKPEYLKVIYRFVKKISIENGNTYILNTTNDLIFPY